MSARWVWIICITLSWVVYTVITCLVPSLTDPTEGVSYYLGCLPIAFLLWLRRREVFR